MDISERDFEATREHLLLTGVPRAAPLAARALRYAATAAVTGQIELRGEIP